MGNTNPIYTGLHQIFEAQADLHPSAIAISFRGEDLTYEQLEAKSNSLARTLKSRGVSHGSLVAILLPRCAEVYVSMLGILKAGAAYVPLDPSYPSDRIEYIMKDSNAGALITTSSLSTRLGWFTGIIIKIDEDAALIESQSHERLPRDSARSDDLCYVIYTSGSTGRPKGVQIEHRNAVHLVETECGIFRTTTADRVCQSASVCFDLSIEEIWLAFGAGATLVPAPPEVSHGGSDFSRFLNESKVTVLSTVPTLLSTLEDECPTLRLLILGGETCPDWVMHRWNLPGRRIVNTYGPTETTVTATYIDLTPGSHVSIGMPLPGYNAYVLDQALNPVPSGEVGEICIGGRGVARGYVGLPKETGERFVRDPFQTDPTARMYRTGDLGRFNADCSLEFLGRIDAQVKLRGFRIELPEIESRIMQINDVRSAVCSIWKDNSGVERLVGYVVLRNGSKLDERAICSRLRDSLPVYMVPSLIEILEQLPKLPNGKLDRAALPKPRPRAAQQTTDNATTETERYLLSVWSSLFRPLPVSVDDDFFLDLGGHSLLAARMVSKVRTNPKFVDVSLADVYENPTVRSLGARVDRRASLLESSGIQKEEKNLVSPKIPHQHTGTSLFQLLALYFPFGFRALEWVTPYLVLVVLMSTGYPLLSALLWAMVSAVLIFPVLFTGALATKWIVLGRIRPGRHPLWGKYYLRWWLVRSIISALPLEYLEGTSLLPAAFRLFGAKVGKDVHLETDKIAAYDLVSIGEGSSIDEDASVLGYSIENGELVLDDVKIGRDCYVGTRSVVREGATIEDAGRLEDLSLLTTGCKIPKGETWMGSPARYSGDARPQTFRTPARSRFGQLSETLAYIFLILSLPLLVFAAVLPGVLILHNINPIVHPASFLVAVPLVGASFVFFVMAEFVILKRALLGQVKSGVYSVHSEFYKRKWVVDQMHSLALDLVAPLHATLYIVPWYRALGAKLGRSVELSTATSIDPDLLELGDESTIADEVNLGSPHTEGGWMTLAPTSLGTRAFVGNSAVIPAGTTMGDGTLCGVLSRPPKDKSEATKKGVSWLGSPPIELPNRQRSRNFAENRTFRPSRRLFVLRGAFESLRVTLPPAGFILVATAVIDITLLLSQIFGLFVSLMLLPVTYGLVCLTLSLSVVATKWLVVRRYTPFERPLWSTFVWRLELINALYEFLATPLTLEPLQGTAFLPAYERLMGAKVGRDVYLHTTGFLEWDLVEVGDGAVLEEDCVLQTHLFEDRILKSSHLKIGKGCHVGAYSVVLYESEMQESSSLDALSLLMKGENLPRNTRWYGIPSRPSGDEMEVVEKIE